MRSECHCPPWVIRCVHFESKVLQLGANVPAWQAHLNTCWHGVVSFPFVVQVIDENTLYEVCVGCGMRYLHAYDGGYQTPSNEADALAAFYAAEEALLRSDPQ